MPLAAVDTLSGDEAHDGPGLGPPRELTKLRAPRRRRPGTGFRVKRKQILVTVEPQKLHYIISSRCGCNADCFDPFRRKHTLYNDWVRLRKLLGSMTKLEQDNHVRDLVLFSCLFQTPFEG